MNNRNLITSSVITNINNIDLTNINIYNYFIHINIIMS